MKKIPTALLLLSLTSSLFAQNKKGDLLVAVNIGSAGVNFGKSESSFSLSPSISTNTNTGFTINIGPNVGYYIADNMVVGTYLGVGYTTSKNKNSSSGSSTVYESKYHYLFFSLMPFARYYFGSNNSKGMPFAEADAGVSFYPGYKGSYEPNSGSGYTYSYKKYTPWSAGVKIGYEHFLNSVIGLQYYVGYTYQYTKYHVFYDNDDSLPDYTSNYKNSSGNINFGLGLTVHLSCTKKKK